MNTGLPGHGAGLTDQIDRSMQHHLAHASIGAISAVKTFFCTSSQKWR